MGIYDRAYLQEEEHSGAWSPGRSMVTNLIIVNVVIWLSGAVFEAQLVEWMALKSNLFTHPWQAWQLVTYGFAHAGAAHLLFNMLGLFFFGRELEGIYGRYEFLRIYLVAIVLAGLVWVAMTASQMGMAELVGASGGVMAIVFLWVLHFPTRLVYIWGVLPVPGWALGTFFVVGDLLGLVSQGGGGGPQVANIAHLAGVGFAWIYYRTKMNLGRFVPRRLGDLKPRLNRPKLRIHDPETESRNLSREVDAILEKISREGEDSLTKKERRTLEEASRRYQRRRS